LLDKRCGTETLFSATPYAAIRNIFIEGGKNAILEE